MYVYGVEGCVCMYMDWRDVYVCKCCVGVDVYVCVPVCVCV